GLSPMAEPHEGTGALLWPVPGRGRRTAQEGARAHPEHAEPASRLSHLQQAGLGPSACVDQRFTSICASLAFRRSKASSRSCLSCSAKPECRDSRSRIGNSTTGTQGKGSISSDPSADCTWLR